MLAFFVVLAVLAVCAQSFSLSGASTRAGSALKMIWGAKETSEHFLIAPSILPANFARLGEDDLLSSLVCSR